MSVLTSCRFIIRGEPLELAKFVKNHIRDGELDLSTFGFDCGEYLSNAPYTVREVGKYYIDQLNIWITLVGRKNCSIDVESDLLEAITKRYPNFQIDYGYYVEDYGGRFVFSDKIVICENYDELKDFKHEFGFKLPTEFNKLMICGNGGKLVKFIENELEYGRVKSRLWGGNTFDLEGIGKCDKTEIAVYFEHDTHLYQKNLYNYFIAKYPNLHFRMYSLDIFNNRFTITQKGKGAVHLPMRDYQDYNYVIGTSEFFTPCKHRDSFYGYNYTKEAYLLLVFKACERYKYENAICNGLSKMMYRKRPYSKSALHYDKGIFNTLI